MQKIQGRTLEILWTHEHGASQNKVTLALDGTRLAVTAIEVTLNLKTHLEHPVRSVIQDGTTHLRT
jgi:transcriptional regulator